MKLEIPLLIGSFLAQLDGGPTPPSWLSILLQGGSFAVLVYLVIRGLPAERQKERDDFAGALKTISDNAQRTEDRLQSLFAAEQAETRKLLYDALGAFRTAVHDVRNTAQTTMNKAAVATEVAAKLIKGDG